MRGVRRFEKELVAKGAKQQTWATVLRRQWHAHARLFVCIVIGLAAWLAVPAQSGTTRFLIAWNIGTWLFIALALKMMWSATAADVRRRADIEEEGRAAMLALIVASIAATFVALVFELSNAALLQGTQSGLHLALALLSISGSWLFMNFAFASHYAHEFHTMKTKARGKDGPLGFPGGEEPDYLDFLYFAIVIGTAFQTSDVEIRSRPMRRIVTIQGLIAFFYNTAVIALTVNIAAQFFGGGK